MDANERDAIARFLHGQVACWNAKDRDGFFAHYRAVAPNGLTIEYPGEYAGQPPHGDAWQALDAMWTSQSARIDIEVVATIVNGREAACHHRNRLIGGDGAIPTIELYRFGSGTLSVRYFIGA